MCNFAQDSPRLTGSLSKCRGYLLMPHEAFYSHVPSFRDKFMNSLHRTHVDSESFNISSHQTAIT